MNFIFVLMCIK